MPLWKTVNPCGAIGEKFRDGCAEQAPCAVRSVKIRF